MLNALDTPNTPLSFEARNISARAGTSKDGPKYKITLECTKEIFDQFITANLESACFAVQMARVDYDNPPLAKMDDTPADDPFFKVGREDAITAPAAPPKTPTGPRCRQAVGLCKDEDFFDDYLGWLDDKDVLAAHSVSSLDFLQLKCGIVSRREFDEGPDANTKWAKFCEIKKAFEKWRDR